MNLANDADEIVQQTLGVYLFEIEQIIETDCFFYCGPIAFGAEDRIKFVFENQFEFNAKNDIKKHGKLTFILQTPGGFPETVQRISNLLRHHYNEVDFLIPSLAMSAGTLLALSGDAIWMDYFSVLGPIDPQIESSDGRQLIPALGYLAQYESLIEKAQKGEITDAEVSILINSFDQGVLYSYIQSRDLSIALLEEWLVKYKFKNWKRTKTKGKKVTLEMKKKRAGEVARILSDMTQWNSHSIGINMQMLRTKVKLHIDDFGQDEKLNFAIKRYHGLAISHMEKTNLDIYIQSRNVYTGRERG